MPFPRANIHSLCCNTFERFAETTKPAAIRRQEKLFARPAMKGRPMKKERLLAFNDAVLAIIMTILVLELKKPDEITLSGFWALRNNYFAYWLSFFWLGSVWISMHGIWEKVELVSRTVLWWNLIFLFFASFMPYATGLVSTHFNNSLAQAFYGGVVIVVTCVNWILHKVVDSANPGNHSLLEATKAFRMFQLPDIAIKLIGLILSLTVYPPAMMYGVLAAAAYVQLTKIIYYKKTRRNPF